MRKIQYRIDNSSILLTDTTTDQYVRIDHELFEEIWKEYRDRMIEKKYTLEDARKARKSLTNQDADRVTPIITDLINSELVPDMLFRINESMAKHNWKVSIGLWTSVVTNTLGAMSLQLLQVYPEQVRSIFAKEIIKDANFVLRRNLLGPNETP